MPRLTRRFLSAWTLGGTNIKIGLVDDLGRTLAYTRIPTNAPGDPEDGCRRMGEATRQLVAEAGLTLPYIARVGLGTPGSMDVASGRLIHPHNLPGWHDFPIRDRLAHHSGLPVTYANDANAAAYGEFWVGSGREFHSLVLLTLGTGIGCGIIIDDFTIVGEHYHGGECGHIIIDYDDSARMCGCGGRGHLEAYASATAVVKRTKEGLGRRPQEHRSPRGCKSRATLRRSWLPKRRGPVTSSRSRSCWIPRGSWGSASSRSDAHDRSERRAVGRCDDLWRARNANWAGGSWRACAEEVRQRALPVPAEQIKIDYASLGDDAGYIGAAGMARAEYRKAGLASRTDRK